jgi:putative molybdopterin biosynthesis protein
LTLFAFGHILYGTQFLRVGAMGSLTRLTRDDQLRAIADSHRLSILQDLMAAPATISQLGVARGKHPAWVRHHVKVLEAAGLISLVETRTVRNYTEKYYGATAPALMIERVVRPEGPDAPVIVFASHDFAMGLLASEAEEGHRPVIGVSGSLDNLIALRQGLADVAGCHLLDVPSGEYNLPYVRHLFPDRPVSVFTVAHREQGLITSPGNPRGLRDLGDIAGAGLRFVNRNRGSGTRLWLDVSLQREGIASGAVDGYDTEVETHSEAAAAVAEGRADVALGVRTAAESAGLGFVPLFRERYDIVVATDRLGEPEVSRLVERLQSRPFRRAAEQLRGYDTEETGTERLVGR